jgi:hypothetical protein
MFMGRLKTHIKNHSSIIADVFIETGTFKGESLDFACSLPFQKLISCDVSFQHYENAKNKFKEDKRVFLHHESSYTLLKKIIDPTKSTTFWLDGHWQNVNKHEMDSSGLECPLLEELKQILSFSWIKKPLILIDDASHYPITNEDKKKYKSGYKINQWPSLIEIKNMIPSNYNFEIIHDVIWISNKYTIKLC